MAKPEMGVIPIRNPLFGVSGEFFYHNGDVGEQEDVWAAAEGDDVFNIGVGDGVSIAYTNAVPGWKKQYVDGLTTGACVASAYADAIQTASPQFSALEVIGHANKAVAGFHAIHLPPEHLNAVDRLAGLTFAFAQMRTNGKIVFVTGGDAIAAWKFTKAAVQKVKKRFGGSWNEVRLHDSILDPMHTYHMQSVLAELQAEGKLVFEDLPPWLQLRAQIQRLELTDLPIAYINKHIRPAMWERSFAPMCVARTRNANGRGPHRYSVMNGLPALMDKLQVYEFDIADLELFVLATDGLYTHDRFASEDPDAIPQFLISRHEKGGFAQMRVEVAGYNRQHEHLNYASDTEGTGVAVRFVKS